MDFVEFTRLQMVKDESEKHINIISSKIEINPDLVCALTKHPIPSEMVGPTGVPMIKIGTIILLPGIEVLVDCKIETVKQMLSGNSDVGRNVLQNKNEG